MSALRHLMVHLNDATLSREVLLLGVALARQHRARLSALLAPDWVATGAYLSTATAAFARQLSEEQMHALHASSAALLAQAQALLGEPIECREAGGDPVQALCAAARTTDLLLVGQRDREAGEGGLDPSSAATLLMNAACPVLCVPHIGWQRRDDGRALGRALVAWSDTRESARALRDALPVLQQAEHVELIRFEPGELEPGAPASGPPPLLDEHLRRHGIEATFTLRHFGEPSLGERLRRGWIPDMGVAEALLSHAADTHADLIVMGGYGHSRAWQAVLGGVTRTMLGSMTVPVLLAH